MGVLSKIVHAALVETDHDFPRELSVPTSTNATIYNVLPYKVGMSHPGIFSPAYARFFRKVVNKIKAHYLYYKPDYTCIYREGRANYTSMNSYADIYHNLIEYTTTMGLYKFTVSGTDHYIIIGHQLIMDTKGNILFLGVSKGYQDTLKPEDSRIYIASEFFNDETYKYVIKKIDSEFLEDFRKEGVEIVIKPSLAIEDEFYGPRVITKYNSLDDFQNDKENLKNLVKDSVLGNIRDTAYNRAKVVAHDDRKYPSPIPYGYAARNLTAEIHPEHQRESNKEWARKLLYLIMENRMNYSFSSMHLADFLEKVHSVWNPETWITINIRNLALIDLIPEFSSLRYSPRSQTFQLATGTMRINIGLKVTHRDEYNLMVEEFGSVENVTFAIEEPLIPLGDEVSPEQDEVTHVRLNDGAILNVREGETVTDSNGTTWTIETPSTSTTNIFMNDDGRYTAGIDEYAEYDEPSRGSLGPGIMEQIRQRGVIHNFGDTVRRELSETDAIQYPLRPDEAFLRAEEDEIVGQQERPEGDEDFDEIDTRERPEASNENTELADLPDWLGESNFTTNEG